jgi:MFS family permease
VNRESDTGLLSGARRGLTIGLVLAVTLVAFEALAVATILPDAEDDLGNLTLYGWVFSAFLLMSLIGIAWSGEQCDRHGPLRPFLAGLAFFAAGLTIAGLAPSMAVLVLGRAVQGLGAGAIPAVSYVTIGRGFDESQRARMFAVLSTAWVVPSLVGPALAGVVSDVSSWRLVFLGLLPALVAVAFMVARPLRALGAPENPPARNSTLHLAAVLAAGAGTLLGGLALFDDSPIAGALLVVAGVGVGLPVLRRLLPAGTLRARGSVPAAILGMGLLNAAFFGAEAYVPFMLTHVRDTSTLFAGLSLTASALSWTTGAWIQERLVARTDRARIVRTGFVLLFLGIAGTSLLLFESVPVQFAAVSWAVAGLGIGMTYPCFSLTVLGGAEAGAVGAASAALKLNEVLGAALGIGIGGAIVAAAPHAERGAIAVTFAIMAATALVGAGLASRVSNRAAIAHAPAVAADSQPTAEWTPGA